MQTATVYTADEILSGLPPFATLLEALADSFVSLSANRIILGPVSHWNFKERQADTCIKSAYKVGGDTWVVKVAAGWYENPKAGLPSSVGIMMVFCQNTGVPRGVLLDGGYLTDLRTALSACVSARCLAPAGVRCVGFVGAGTIPRLLLETLPTVLECNQLLVWARRMEAAENFAADANTHAFGPRSRWRASACGDLAALVLECDVIFTCTPSREPLLTAAHVAARPAHLSGLHIHALGSDQLGKQELEAALLGMADLIVPDSPKQCFAYGELAHAKVHGLVTESDPRVVELGVLLSSKAHLQRARAATAAAPQQGVDRRLTIADSTGVGASDLCIAEAAYAALAPGVLPTPPPHQHAWKDAPRSRM